ANITDFVILERIDDIGGTWARNTYPGAACDVPSTLYSYSFAPNPEWQNKFGTQPEIHAYIKRTAAEHNIPAHIQFNTEVQAATFNEANNQWELRTNQGAITADVFIAAAGPFAEAAYPNIKGLDSTDIPVIHRLHWDHSVEISNKRVAIIGTGAAAVQIIPQLQPLAKKLTVFQRTPPWIVPRLDRKISAFEKRLYRLAPITQKMSRAGWYAMIESFGLVGFVNVKIGKVLESLGRLQLKRQVKNPELRKKLTPQYTIGCKRAIFSDNYYPSLTQPNVALLTQPISHIAKKNVITTDGKRHPVDYRSEERRVGNE